jgi:beta-galactosidase
MDFKPITFDNTCYRIDRQPVYLNSGEFHYFRVPREDWSRRMELFKQAGGNCLATYIPWVIHEPVEGHFAFSDTPKNDLEGFLQAARQAGLYVVARPGPYQYSELLYNGLPHWLCINYPQLLATDLDNRVIDPASVSYLHPLFLQKSWLWFEQVCPILAKYTLSRGGPIAFTQIDNELAGIHTWNGSLDYNRETMGFGRPEGRFSRFLQLRYGSIQALNQAYGIQVSCFENVMPVSEQGGSTPQELRRRRDYFEFYLAGIAEYARLLADWLRQSGIDTPIIHNSAGPEMNALFKETTAAMGKDFILGSDHYYNLDQSWPQNNPTPQYARRVFFSLEMLRLMGFPPTVYELPGGSLSDWPPVTPSDARTCYLTNVALGMKAHNYYIFTGGTNPPGVGSTTDTYDYGAAISASGEVRPLYEVQKEFGLFMRSHPFLVETERESDCRFTLDWQMAHASSYWQKQGEFSLSGTDAWRYLLEGSLTTALCASLSPVFCDLDAEDWLNDRSTPVVVNTSPVMSAEKQQRIIRFVQSGGKALLLPVLPGFDEDWMPCTLLQAFAGAQNQHASGKTPTRLTIAGVENIYNNGQAFLVPAAPPSAEAIGIDERSGQVASWSVRTSTGGELLVLGFAWRHGMRQHEQMLYHLLTRLGLKQKVVCSNSNVWTSLRTTEHHSMLFLMNLFSSPQKARVHCQPSWSKRLISVDEQHLDPMTVKAIELS